MSHLQKPTFHKPLTVTGKNKDEFGEALEAWFKTNAVYGVYKKFGRGRTERAFNEMQKIKDHSWVNLMQRLHHD